ncbi:MAG: nuclear transport factor 2 family protein [Acidimicrobiales bacterium]
MDRTAVADVAIRYCGLIDGGRWPELDQVFVPDAVFHLPDGEYRGLDAIRSRISRALGPLDNSQHLVSNHQVTLEEAGADHRCYFQAQHVRSGPTEGSNYIVAGRYDDRFIRTDQGWRIVDRTLTVMWTEGNERVLRP